MLSPMPAARRPLLVVLALLPAAAAQTAYEPFIEPSSE